MKSYLIPLACTVFLTACADIEAEQTNNPEDITSSVEGSTPWSLGSIPMNMQIQEATLLCKEQGGILQIVDTRIAAPSNLNSIEFGDVQFMCFGTTR